MLSPVLAIVRHLIETKLLGVFCFVLFFNSGIAAQQNKITTEAAVSQLFATKIKLQQVRIKQKALDVFCFNSIS